MKIEDAIQAKFQSPQHKAVVNLRFTANFLSNIQNNFMAQFHLTMPQFNILRILRGAKDAINVNTVKERMLEKSPNTTRLMDKLCDKGFIERVRCENDRRVVYVKINEKGLALLNKINMNEFDSCMQKISEMDAKLLNDILDKLR